MNYIIIIDFLNLFAFCCQLLTVVNEFRPIFGANNTIIVVTYEFDKVKGFRQISIC